MSLGRWLGIGVNSLAQNTHFLTIGCTSMWCLLWLTTDINSRLSARLSSLFSFL